MIDLSQIVFQQLGTNIIDPGAAFMYLFRRFGPTQFGSDPRSELCVYAIPTQKPELWLMLRIDAAMVNVYAAMTNELLRQYIAAEREAYQEWRNKRHEWAKKNNLRLGRDENISPKEQERLKILNELYPPPELDEVREKSELINNCYIAIEQGLQDLLIGVPVGPDDINILGITDASEHQPFVGAGYGVYTDVYEDPDLWEEFMIWLKEEGDGQRLHTIRNLLEKSQSSPMVETRD